MDIILGVVMFTLIVLALVLVILFAKSKLCLLYTSPSPRDVGISRMPSSA